MLKSRLGVDGGVKTVILGDFEIEENARTYNPLPDYDEFQGSDLSDETGVSAISHRILGDFINLRCELRNTN